MRFSIVLLITCIAVVLVFSGCDMLEEIVPMPEEIADAEPTEQAITPTPLPELGELQALDAAFCWQSLPDAHELEFTLLRFFPDGTVFMVTVKGYNTCAETWEYIKPYLDEKDTKIYSHGNYQYSQGQLRFELSPPGSTEVAGEAYGTIEGSELLLTLQGTEKLYKRVYGGEK